MITAEEAAQIGLVNKVVSLEAGEPLQSEALKEDTSNKKREQTRKPRPLTKS